MNAILKQLKTHVSIRKFNSEKISSRIEKEIINAAMRGATAGNMMSYSIIKIRSRDTLKTLSKSCDNQPFIGDADLALLFVVDNYKWHRYFQAKGIPEFYNNYQGPVVNDLVLGMQDAMIAAQNAVIAAESLGIGTCYIGDIIERYEFHKELFNLPEYTMPATLVVMGYYDKKPRLNTRFDSTSIVFEEKYPCIDDKFLNKMFGEKEKISNNFARNFFNRKINVDFFNEMKRSLELYLNQWFSWQPLSDKRVVTCKQMKEIERIADAGGLSYYQMMENAGTAAAEIIKRDSVKGKRVIVFCGRGNNGGDGFVVARRLHEEGAIVWIILVHGEPKSGDAIANLSICRHMAIPEKTFESIENYHENHKADIIIDAIYGTGFRGDMGLDARKIASCINNSNGKVYSLDIPSGLTGDTGVADPCAIIAHCTLVFHSFKPAHVIGGTSKYCGKCILVDIGIK